jgi:hypothetical protein
MDEDQPLKDVDIFCVFHDDERPKYRNDSHPSVVLEAVRAHLAKKYGNDAVKKQRRPWWSSLPTQATKNA